MNSAAPDDDAATARLARCGQRHDLRRRRQRHRLRRSRRDRPRRCGHEPHPRHRRDVRVVRERARQPGRQRHDLRQRRRRTSWSAAPATTRSTAAPAATSLRRQRHPRPHGDARQLHEPALPRAHRHADLRRRPARDGQALGTALAGRPAGLEPGGATSGSRCSTSARAAAAGTSATTTSRAAPATTSIFGELGNDVIQGDGSIDLPCVVRLRDRRRASRDVGADARSILVRRPTDAGRRRRLHRGQRRQRRRSSATSARTTSSAAARTCSA